MKESNIMIITRGYPASGKSTFASSWVAEDPTNRVEVNRDTIRGLFGVTLHQIGSHSTESAVTKIQMEMISAAMADEKDIVVSDTNVRDRSVKKFMSTAVSHNYEVVLKDFQVDVDELISRDSCRENPVGEKVIRDFAMRFPYKHWSSFESLMNAAETLGSKKTFEPVVNDPKLPPAVVFDIDGTLAQMGDRSAFDWSLVGEDTVNENVAELSRSFYSAGFTVIVFSGRDNVCREETEEWLRKNNIQYHELHMRGEDSEKRDVRKDSIVKYEMVKKHLEGRFYVHTVFDDRDQVVAMWREAYENNPTICFQVNYGDF